ncbi:MAG: hypothetical protein QM642_02820 [Edaphocola sp.]
MFHFSIKNTIYGFGVAVAASMVFASCVKDRDITPVTPTPPVVTDSGSTNEIIHYWDFNDKDNLLDPTLTLLDGSLGVTDTYDEEENGGTLLNARNSSDSGHCFRDRNPSTSFTINAPTTGHDSVYVSFAVMRTNNGAQTNKIEYSIDGTSYITTGLATTQIVVGLTWQVFGFDFSGISGVKDNADFKVRITFADGNDNASGNDRYDNIVVEGTQL